MALTENEFGIIDLQCVGMFDMNCYFIYMKKTKNLYIIDSGSDAIHIIKKAKQFEYDKVYLIQTHCHVDHISALAEVKEELNPEKLYIHKNELGLYKSQDNFFLPYYHLAKNLPEPNEDYSPNECEVLETPGHTKGGVCFYFKELSAVFTGDTLFQQSIGRTDLPGGNHSTLIKSINQKLMTLPENIVVYPGHGPTTTIGKEKKHNPYI